MFNVRIYLPVIASGGAGTLEHFVEALTDGKADAVLAASLFHFGTFTIKQVKDYLREKGIEVGGYERRTFNLQRPTLKEKLQRSAFNVECSTFVFIFLHTPPVFLLPYCAFGSGRPVFVRYYSFPSEDLDASSLPPRRL